MKANTSKTNANKEKITNKKSNINGPLLSIGLIVKNEEKYLRKCLEALDPLMKTGKTEIIIVDTGSTDNTVSIAKDFTDKVYFFEWINDFAAARNYGLERATGKWFMYIDADEIFDETVAEILKFLESPTEKKYNSVAYHIRNYTDDSLERYDEFVPVRLQRITDDTKFVGAIHECFEAVPPVKTIKTYAYHYGYVGQKLALKKSDRNMHTLYKDYEQDPKNPRTLMYMYNGLMKKSDKERYLKEWIEVADSSSKDKLTMLAYLSGAQFYSQIGNVRKSVFYAEKLLGVKGVETNIKSLMAYHYLGDGHIKLFDYDLAIEAYEKYFEKYKEYQEDKLDFFGTAMLSGLRDEEYICRRVAYALCLSRVKRYDEAVGILKSIDYSLLELDGKQFIILALVELCNAVKIDYDFENVRPVLSAYLVYVRDNNQVELGKLVSELYWKMNKTTHVIGFEESNARVYKARLDVFTCLTTQLSNNYFGIIFDSIKLMSSLSENEAKVAATQLVQPIIDVLPKYERGYELIIWEAIKYNCSLQKVLININRKGIETMAATFAIHTCDYSSVIKNFIEQYQAETIKELYFEIALVRKVLSDCNEFWYPYSMLLANYVSNIYTEDILNDDDITVLSDEERLGYYMYKADGALQVDDKMEYIHYLRLALDVCPGMKETIKEIADGMDIGEEEDK